MTKREYRVLSEDAGEASRIGNKKQKRDELRPEISEKDTDKSFDVNIEETSYRTAEETVGDAFQEATDRAHEKFADETAQQAADEASQRASDEASQQVADEANRLAASITACKAANDVARNAANDAAEEPLSRQRKGGDSIGQATPNGKSESHTFAGFLFDLDGTIINTTEAITKHWNKIGAALGVDPKVIIDSSRGRRSIDTIQLYDPSKANWKYVSHIESVIPKEYGSSASETPGARSLLQSLDDASAPWALVTSCTRALLQGWLELMSLPAPVVSVAAEDVAKGKPDPACYELGRERIGVTEQSRVLVVEDSPSGVVAGKAAGCAVLGLATTHSVEKLRSAGADWILEDLSDVEFVGKKDEGYTIRWGIEASEFD